MGIPFWGTGLTFPPSPRPPKRRRRQAPARGPAAVSYTHLDVYKRQLLDFAEAGDNIGVLLRGVQRTEIERGQVLAKPGSIHPHTHFMGQVYVLTKEEGCLLYTSRCV